MDRNALAELLQALESRRDAEERRREERYTALIERPVFNERPRILQRGAWTQAAPYKEEKFHRRVRLEAPGAVGSGERLISDAATWGSDYHPEGLGCCSSPPPPPLLVPRMPVCEEELPSASRLPPLQRAPDRSLGVPWRGGRQGVPGANQAPGPLKRDHPPHVGCLQDRDPGEWPACTLFYLFDFVLLGYGGTSTPDLLVYSKA
ncbi:UNVERIFIED_CONTAM: hypothetical protein FKN15_044862 [Acipenser sinensis]